MMDFDTDPFNPLTAFEHMAEIDRKMGARPVNLSYIFYANRRRAGASAEALLGIFPQAEAFERMFLAGEQ